MGERIVKKSAASREAVHAWSPIRKVLYITTRALYNSAVFQSFFERFPRALEQPYRLTLSDPIDGFPGAGPGAVIVAQDRAVVRCAHRMGGQTEAVPLEDVLGQKNSSPRTIKHHSMSLNRLG